MKAKTHRFSLLAESSLGANTLLSLACSIAFIVGVPCLMGQDCAAVPQETIHRVEGYLGQRLTTATSKGPEVQSISLVPNTCYHKLLIQIPGAADTVAMYLSPDGRFLTSTLYDLEQNAKVEVAHIAADVQSLLMHDPSPRMVGSASRIVLVELATCNALTVAGSRRGTKQCRRSCVSKRR